MIHTVWLTIVVLVVIPDTFGVMTVGAQRPGSPPGKNSPPPKNDAVDVSYGDIVTAVTKNSITLQGAGEEPKTFPVSETLADGKIPSVARHFPGWQSAYWVAPTLMYRLSDVKVGDWVEISYAYLGGVSICDHINIYKRPGERVPPLPEEAEAQLNPAGPTHLILGESLEGA